MTARALRVAGALVDLTRILYFGPAVGCLFVLGAVLAMPHAPQWGALGRVLFLGLVGFSGGFVLNDVADWRADRAMLAARAHDAEYLAQLRRERAFTHTRPIAAGIVSPGAGLAYALALISISAAVCFTFPAPHRWYLLAILAYCSVAEPAYCAIKKRQRVFPVATFFHAPLEALCPVAAYLAVRAPALTCVGLFASIYCWEVGFNQLYDTIDVENDRVRGVTTLSSVLGVRFVAGWAFTFSLLSTAGFAFTWWASHSGPVMLAGVLAAGALMAGADAVLFLRPRKEVARTAIRLHLLQIILAVSATAADAALRWAGVY